MRAAYARYKLTLKHTDRQQGSGLYDVRSTVLNRIVPTQHLGCTLHAQDTRQTSGRSPGHHLCDRRQSSGQGTMKVQRFHSAGFAALISGLLLLSTNAIVTTSLTSTGCMASMSSDGYCDYFNNIATCGEWSAQTKWVSTW